MAEEVPRHVHVENSGNLGYTPPRALTTNVCGGGKMGCIVNVRIVVQFISGTNADSNIDRAHNGLQLMNVQ